MEPGVVDLAALARKTLMAAKVAFALSIPFLAFFVWGLTDIGQEVLRGPIPPNTELWRVIDINEGAAGAPYVFGLFPFLLLVSIGLFLFTLALWARRPNRRTESAHLR